MAKIDKKVKKELEERTIAPSAGSWTQLSSQLETKDKKKASYKWYLGIAASFLAGILIASFFGNGNETEVEVVSTQEEIAPKSAIEKKENIFATEIEGELVYDTQVLKEIVGDLPQQKETKSQEITKPESQNKNSSYSKNHSMAKGKTESIAVAELKKKNLLTEKNSEKISEEKKTDENQAALLAQVEDEEIDALLENARRKVRLRNFKNPYARVSAKELLENIEVEDKESFKEKVLLALESGFQHVKSTVIK
ncbi:hypothetical protein ACFQ3R_08060 [Mesonia ostreae]|uniref:Anti-sigma factor n=1 Tax=Mesonia ostreae TaxID=861110 RepID=A0ABU2KF86_9FLAO|nr:hypothetical protein [Mesonia ostreae]MDT0293375.1 hypothetical protein [Mesonia ostreae]